MRRRLPPIEARAPICPLGRGNRTGYRDRGCRCRPCSRAHVHDLCTNRGVRPRHQTDWVNVERLAEGRIPFREATITEREAAVWRLTDRGESATWIAERLGCTERTVTRIRARRPTTTTPWRAAA